ncbi:MAG: hypothetical protein WC856_20515 [Methylococcaceae bacterium]
MPLTQQTIHRNIQAGRDSIEYRMLEILMRPRACTADDDVEMKKLSALLKQYNELMSPYELPDVTVYAATNDEDGNKD